MISFNLICKNDHEFEGWFPNSAGFEEQHGKKRIECPVCGSRKVERALSAPNISTGESRDASRREKMLKAAEEKKVMMAKMRSFVKDNCDYVGSNFAEEARKIHYGETDERGIYGESTIDEAKELAEEGIPVAPIPWMEENKEH